MGKLSETKVQMVALKYLTQKYRRKAKRKRVFADIEVRTRRKVGGGRADGLLAYRNFWGGLRVVSMEAKSYNTLGAIRPQLSYKLLLWNSFRAGLLICLLSGAFMIWYEYEDLFWKYAIPINTFVIGALLYAYISRHHFGHLSVDMIRQISRYPANYRWLAISRDALGALSQSKQKALVKICRQESVGLISVNYPGQVEELVSAKVKVKWSGSFLTAYAREKGILQEIG